MPWPDIEVELVTRLSSVLGVRVLTDLPASLDQILPVVQVQRIGGSDDGFRLDRALIDVDVYAATRGGASLLARQAHSALVVGMRGLATSAAVFGRVSTVSAASWRPYENPNLRRFGATYELFVHAA